MSFKRFTVRTKIVTVFAVFLTCFVGYAAWTWNTLSVVKVGGPHYKSIVDGKDLLADILPPPNYIIESYLMTLHMANEIADGAAPETMQFYAKRCKQLEEEFDERHAFWLTNLDKGPLKTVKTVDAYEPAAAFYRVMNGQFIPACLSGDADTAALLVRSDLREHYLKHRTAIDQVVELASARCDEDQATATAILKARTNWSIGIVVAALVLAGALAYVIVGETVSPLRRSAHLLRSLSTKDLADVGRRLRTGAEKTSDQATQASGTASEVSANAQSLATAVEQFEASIKEIAANASNAASVARNAVGAADQTNQTINRLGESSAEIGNVIKAINSIAEQTNLLALNATIEAARAGEAGKGFAVVANEVKELAKETSNATEEIIGRIETIQSDTQQAVSAIGLVSEIISEISESQNAIAGAVEQQTAMTSEISRSISEVALGSGEIADNIGNVADACNATTTESEQTLATAANIEQMAAELLAMVGSTDRDPPPVPQGKYTLTAPREDTYVGSI